MRTALIPGCASVAPSATVRRPPNERHGSCPQIDPRGRRRRRHRRRDRAPLRARRPDRLRDAAQRRQARAAGRADPAEGGEAHGFASDASKEADVETLVAQHRARGRADRGRRLQHRRQRSLRHRRDDRARLPQGLGDGRAGRLPDGPRGRQGDARRAAAARSSSPARPRACAARPASPPSPAPSTRCARWRKAWRASSGRKGIHVAHVVIDGAIDTRFIAENFPERYALKDKDGILAPDAIADNYWNLHRQDKSAWTHELDLQALAGELVSTMSERSERSSTSSTSAARRPTSHGRSCRRSPPRPARRSPGGRCCSAASSRRPATPAR